MNASKEINDEEKEDERSQRKTLMIFFILFCVIFFILLVLIVLSSAFLVHKSGHPRRWNPFDFISSKVSVENDLSCLKPDCVETCYTMDNEYAQKMMKFSLNESFHIARTEFKVEIQATYGSLVQINMMSPTDRMVWDFEIRLMKNTINLISDLNDVKVENVTEIEIKKNFFVYAKPILDVNHTLTGFHFDIQALNRSKISLGEVSVKLEPKEMVDLPEVPYRFEIYGPFRIFGYCTSTKTH
uniref:Uncharacterized protein n=1 Tax=Romanomermis culicivorax TaxID=13658 RepID=A0A915KPH5_ROMCU